MNNSDISAFREEAIPFVIYNNEKRSKYTCINRVLVLFLTMKQILNVKNVKRFVYCCVFFEI